MLESECMSVSACIKMHTCSCTYTCYIWAHIHTEIQKQHEIALEMHWIRK